jgi:hypothetical protein
MTVKWNAIADLEELKCEIIVATVRLNFDVAVAPQDIR